jgi:hypothetical protein
MPRRVLNVSSSSLVGLGVDVQEASNVTSKPTSTQGPSDFMISS